MPPPATLPRAPGGTIRPRLRHETGPLHREVEGKLSFLGPGLSLDGYRRVLETFLGFWAPVESRLAALARARDLAFEVRARAPLLAEDLRFLGASAADVGALPLCRDLPAWTSAEHAAGALYVLEGSCLGGQVIARELRSRLGLTAGRGASFFRDDGPATAARWKAYLLWLDAFVAGGADTDEVVAAAAGAFRAFGRWVDVREGRA